MSQQQLCAAGTLVPVAVSYVTEAEFARLVGTTPSTLARWRRQGRLPASIKLGSTRYFDRGEVAEFLKRGN